MRKPIRAIEPKTVSTMLFCRPFVALALAACSSSAPYATTTGELAPNTTITVSAKDSTIEIYRPAQGDPTRRFTVSATSRLNATPPAAPTIRRAGNGIVITAENALDRLLLRVPDRVNVVVQDTRGNVSVTGISGNADVTTQAGDVRIELAGYAQASTGSGHLSVTFGASEWPGTLKFSNGDGDVEVYVIETTRFRVHLHTGDGTLFSDFGLRGSARGKAETIDGAVNGGGTQGIDIETKRGTIRLLRLAPQA
ncbi:MAG: DUF4097 domain-containing protein [Candidatus Eremiobacteraeota bacterium]|nr:DUF4097 domain-containing protein [Candidatus Eremiobacteraeota bacterium]